MKKILSSILALLLCLSAPAASAVWDGHASPIRGPLTGHITRVTPGVSESLNNFKKVRDYVPGSVVPAGAWYEEAFQTLYELGLAEDSFAPRSTVSLGEAVSLAVRFHCIYNGWNVPPEGMSGVQYAVNTGIISEGAYEDYTAPASRRSFAAILANALPPEALKGVNAVAEGAIPDVPPEDPGAKGVYTLYRAGVLVGGDAQGSFCPDSAITRAAAVVIAARMADPSLRQTAAAFTAGVTDVTLDRTSLIINVGWSRSLTAQVFPINAADQAVTWASSEPRTAVVDQDGRVTAIRPGTAVIMATTANGLRASCAVKVMDPY